MKTAFIEYTQVKLTDSTQNSGMWDIKSPPCIVITGSLTDYGSLLSTVYYFRALAIIRKDH